jgi:hypothetical protein
MMRTFLLGLFVLTALVTATAAWTGGGAAAAALPGCASGAAPGQAVFTVSVSATGKPFVTPYVASAPTAGGSAGCAAPSPPAAPSFIVQGPGVAPYPQVPVSVPVPATVPAVPMNVHLVQVGSNVLVVPHNPSLQVYQIAPGYYVVRSLDPSGNTSVVLPLAPAPQAPNTGPIPSVIH